MQPKNVLGKRLKALRKRKGVGLKKAAPEVGVSYTYLSKIENERAVPSEGVLSRLAYYYETSEDELLIMADRIPEDIRRILKENPRESADLLRRFFSGAGIS